MRHQMLLFLSGAYLIATNLVWIAYDTRPPFWDMAAHQSAALRIYEAFRTTSVIDAMASVGGGLTGYYPPAVSVDRGALL